MIGQHFGRYEILSLLGRGGMADVYLAHDPQLERDVAIKLMNAIVAEQDNSSARFMQEARAVARLRHAHIVQVYDFAVADGRPYMVMEYVDGGSLKIRESGQPLSNDEALRIAAAIGSAIDYAHQQGLVHRDIKPANILFTRAGEPVLTDFGIAKISGQTMNTVSGSVSGTPTYMAPEQAQGSADARSDLYSFAVVVYEMLTGRAPFSADTPLAMLMKHLHEPPPSPLVWRNDLPAATADVFRKALAKNPDERFASANEIVSALRAALAGEVAASIAQDAPTLHDARTPSAVNAALKVAAPAPLNPAQRALHGLASLAAIFAPLVGRQQPELNQQVNNRREQIASLMAMIGILLAAFQTLTTAFDVVSKSFAPLLAALPVLIVVALVLGALAAVNALRSSPSAQRRRRAGLLLAVLTLAALGWSGWQVYERVREPSVPILLVADFKRCDTCKERIIGAQIYERLKLELGRLKLANIELQRTFDAYSSSDIARARGADAKATLVIWGLYDDDHISPHVELLRAPSPSNAHLPRPEDLSAADFHLQGGDREITFMALLALGLTRFADGDFANALTLYDAALQSSGDASAPNAEVAYFYKALTEYENGEAPDDVQSNLQKAIALKPKWADAHFLLALTYLDTCKPDGTNARDLLLKESETAVQQRADANTYRLRGFALAQSGRWSEAAQSFEQSLKLKEDAEVRRELSEAYRNMGRDDLAQQAQQKLTTAKPRSGDEASALSAEGDTLYAQAKYADAALRYQQAISRALTLKQPHTTVALLYGSLAQAQSAQANDADALRSYRQAETLWGAHWPSYKSLALVAEKAGQPDDAIAAYQKAIANLPCDANAHSALGRLYTQQSRNAQAIDEFRKAITADPSDGLNWVSLANLLAQQSKFDEADAALQNAVKPLENQLAQEPTNARMLFVLGSTYFLLEQYASALNTFRKYTALAPNDADGFAWLARSAEAQKDWTTAAKAYESLLALKPNDAATHEWLAFVYGSLDRADDALKELRAAATLDANNATYQTQLALALVIANQNDEAISAAQRALQLDANQIVAHYVLGLAHKAKRDSAQAIRELQIVVQSANASAQLKQAAQQALQGLQ